MFFRKNRDAAVTTPKILDPGPGRDDFVIIPMVYDEKLVVGELKFWITIAASKEVRVEPVPDTSLVEPRGGEAGDDEEDEDDDNDYEDVQLLEPTYAENAAGGFVVKGAPRDWRSTRQIAEACAKMNCKYQDPDFPCSAEGKPKFLRPCWKGEAKKDEHLTAVAPVLQLASGGIGALKQGAAADSWLLGALAAVATKPDLLQALPRLP